MEGFGVFYRSGKLAEYSLNPEAKTDYVLVDKIVFGPPTVKYKDLPEQDKKPAIQTLFQLKLVGQGRAEKIYDSFIESKRVYDFKKQIGITKGNYPCAEPRLI